MPHIALAAAGTTAHERLLGHNPAVLERWSALETTLMQSPTFDAVLRARLRQTLAARTGCQYCLAKAGPPGAPPVDRRASLAVGFAESIGQDHRQIDAARIAELRALFTAAEVAELTALACFLAASQAFGAILGLTAADASTGAPAC